MATLKQKVARLYSNPKLGFTGATTFIKSRKFSEGNKVLAELNKIPAYVLHRPVRTKFKRRQFIVHFPLFQFQIDLISLLQYKKYNNGYSYILCCIDSFTKKVCFIKMKHKNKETTLSAIKLMIKRMGKPNTIVMDKG